MSDFEGSYKWFANLSEPLWRAYVLPRFANHGGPINYIETGVAEGASMCWAIENLGRPGGLFVGIDPYLDSRHWHEGEGETLKSRALANISACYGVESPDPSSVADHFGIAIDGRPHFEMFIEKSQDRLQHEERRFDLAFVDGHHDANNALLDILLVFRLLKEDGVLIVDDIDRKIRGGRPQVWPAILAFEATHEGYFDKLYEHQKQFAYVKRPRRRHGYPPVMVQGPVIVPK